MSPDIPYILPRPDDPQRPPYGWFRKALWALDSGATAPVTLRGTRLGDGSPLWIGFGDEQPMAAAVLDPEHPGVPAAAGDWLEFPSYVYFPATGCYELIAEWAGGGWRTTIPFVAPADAPAGGDARCCDA